MRDLTDRERILLLEGAVSDLQRKSQEDEKWQREIRSLVDQMAGMVRMLKLVGLALIGVMIPLAAAVVQGLMQR